jgi:hypothetical protein
MDDGRPISEVPGEVVCAHAYLGAAPIVAALAGGARLVITGRVADAALTLAPAMHRFGIDATMHDRLAAASVCGHLIECGSQVTGGYSGDWESLRLDDIGYPIAELSADGTCVITKPPGTGGAVTRGCVAEQLVYEIGDPSAYVTPDVIVDFTAVEIESVGADRVAVRGAKGRPAPDDYKVSIAYRDGFTATAVLLVTGSDAARKAHACADIVLARLRRAGFELAQSNVECLGDGDGVPRAQRPAAAPSHEPREVVLRMTVRDPRREAVERFSREIAPLITSGPAGLAGYAAGRPQVRQAYGFWPALVPKSLVDPHVDVRVQTAAAWETSP